MKKEQVTDKILVLDFGSQYSQLIARRVRECGVYCELHPYDMSQEKVQAFGPCGIILSGGPESVTDERPPLLSPFILQSKIPILGICYGMQAIAFELGGSVATTSKKEFGLVQIEQHGNCELFKHLDTQLGVWMSHCDQVITLPPGFSSLAYSENTPIVAMADENRRIYGVQFHPEVTHTQQGKELLNSFVHNICQATSTWQATTIIEDLLHKIRIEVGDDHVILGLSGGVDSSVLAALLHKAIGDQLTCILVDTGLLRLQEAQLVMQTFSENMGLHVIHVRAEKEFLEKLAGVCDPEAKRKIIGKEFITVFEKQAAQIQGAKWLAQGTIYSDVIESAGHGKNTKTIKSHHNVGGLPAHMHLKLLEPLRTLFKDEVRNIGLALGLPHEMIFRHPFPGPGLGVRILGEVKHEYVTILRHADAIFIEELQAYKLYEKVSQAFAVFLPVKSVGVVGDNRQYEYVIALRAVETVDFMTAHICPLPYDFLLHVTNRILNEVANVSRVVYDISGKPPATIEWE